MARFKIRLIEVDAYQWMETAPAYPIPPVPHTHLRERRPWFRKPYWEVRTMEGWLRIYHLDWVICTIGGEWYLCHSRSFAKIYEEVT